MRRAPAREGPRAIERATIARAPKRSFACAWSFPPRRAGGCGVHPPHRLRLALDAVLYETAVRVDARERPRTDRAPGQDVARAVGQRAHDGLRARLRAGGRERTHVE